MTGYQGEQGGSLGGKTASGMAERRSEGELTSAPALGEPPSFLLSIALHSSHRHPECQPLLVLFKSLVFTPPHPRPLRKVVTARLPGQVELCFSLLFD